MKKNTLIKSKVERIIYFIFIFMGLTAFIWISYLMITGLKVEIIINYPGKFIFVMIVYLGCLLGVVVGIVCFKDVNIRIKELEKERLKMFLNN